MLASTTAHRPTLEGRFPVVGLINGWSAPGDLAPALDWSVTALRLRPAGWLPCCRVRSKHGGQRYRAAGGRSFWGSRASIAALESGGCRRAGRAAQWWGPAPLDQSTPSRPRRRD